MTSNPRHGLPPRLMAHQPTRFAAAQESKPSPSPGNRIRSNGCGYRGQAVPLTSGRVHPAAGLLSPDQKCASEANVVSGVAGPEPIRKLDPGVDSAANQSRPHKALDPREAVPKRPGIDNRAEPRTGMLREASLSGVGPLMRPAMPTRSTLPVAPPQPSPQMTGSCSRQ